MRSGDRRHLRSYNDEHTIKYQVLWLLYNLVENTRYPRWHMTFWRTPWHYRTFFQRKWQVSQIDWNNRLPEPWQIALLLDVRKWNEIKKKNAIWRSMTLSGASPTVKIAIVPIHFLFYFYTSRHYAICHLAQWADHL